MILSTCCQTEKKEREDNRKKKVRNRRKRIKIFRALEGLRVYPNINKMTSQFQIQGEEEEREEEEEVEEEEEEEEE